MGKRRHRRVEPTDDWQRLELLLKCPEQVRYEEIRPLVLFGNSVAERARETGSSERTLYRRVDRFRIEGMESLFDTQTAKHQKLPPSIRRLIVNLKTEHPRMSLGEIANVVYVHAGRKPSKHSIKRVLREEPIPLRLVRRFPPYHEISEARERRMAIVRLHAEGWTVTSIASYLRTSRQTVYQVLKRWIAEGEEGLEDKPRGRPKGVRKVNLRAIKMVRELQRNPELGEFRIHAALKQLGINLSPRTCGRILALNRRLYGLETPKAGRRERKQMPFASSRRHRYWTADVRYLDHQLGGNVYVISILENHSRAILSSAVTRKQDLVAFLSVFYTAVERYGSPEALVTDGGAIFRADQANAIYESLGVTKEEIERGQSWQSYIETAFNIQRRMADFHFARAQSWEELAAAHDEWVSDYNDQSHWAHRERKDGRRSPSEVLGWITGVRYREEDLRRAFFSTRHARKLDALGYATFLRWKLYGEESLAGSETALWLAAEKLTLEHAGEPLSRYEVDYEAKSGKLLAVRSPTLFESSHRRSLPQPRLFGLEALGEAGWLKAIKLEEYAPRRLRWPSALQQVLFAYIEAI
jgi:putative transposase